MREKKGVGAEAGKGREGKRIQTEKRRERK